MDVRLMKEFEELEGLTDQHIDDDVSQLEEPEEDESFRPVIAANLNNADVYEEMEKRSLKSTGFPDTDREILQEAFDEEFKKDLEKARADRREVRRRAARQAGLQRRRMMMEKMLQEEQDELARNHQIGMMIELIKENNFAISARLDVNSVSARCLSKAMWSNDTITCLDLSSNELSDHAGSYLARMLKRNSTLKKLELDNNNLGKLTCTAFSESLAVNHSLLYLSLDSNPLCSDSDGMAAFSLFAESLSVNKSLKSLNLWRIGAGVLGGAVLSRNVLKNSQLLFCDVSHNGMEMKDIVLITAQLDKNLMKFEEHERIRRQDEEFEKKIEEEHKQKEETQHKQKELSSWLEQRRCQRAESRRLQEAERLEQIQLEQEERQRQLQEEKERARKAAEEAEAKKKKKKGKGKGKK